MANNKAPSPTHTRNQTSPKIQIKCKETKSSNEETPTSMSIMESNRVISCSSRGEYFAAALMHHYVHQRFEWIGEIDI